MISTRIVLLIVSFIIAGIILSLSFKFLFTGKSATESFTKTGKEMGKDACSQALYWLSVDKDKACEILVRSGTCGVLGEVDKCKCGNICIKCGWDIPKYGTSGGIHFEGFC